MTLKIETGFDGSCPHFDEGVKQDKDGTFVLFPQYRAQAGESEESERGGSRLSTRIVNESPKPLEAKLRVEWGAKRAVNHDLGYVRHESDEEWTMIPGVCREETILYNLAVQPGTTLFGLYPEYNYAQCAGLAAGMKQKGVKVDVIGQSREGRDMWMLSFPSSNSQAANWFLQARDHAYETAGSYCVEGITEFLLADEPLSRYLRSKFNVYVVPMTNPDGVFNGMSRLTWEQGADMNRIVTREDTAHATLKAAVDRVRPAVHMNIHNWTGKFVDGLLSNEVDIAERIQEHMPADTAHFKRWMVQTLYSFLQAGKRSHVPDANRSWKDYCKDEFDAIGVNFEFPWFTLNTADMREKGKRAFVAFALAVIEDQAL